MPHGGYHGTVVMGGNIVQQGYQKPDGSYGISGGIDDASRLDKNPPITVKNNIVPEDKQPKITPITPLDENDIREAYIAGSNVFIPRGEPGDRVQINREGIFGTGFDGKVRNTGSKYIPPNDPSEAFLEGIENQLYNLYGDDGNRYTLFSRRRPTGIDSFVRYEDFPQIKPKPSQGFELFGQNISLPEIPLFGKPIKDLSTSELNQILDEVKKYKDGLPNYFEGFPGGFNIAKGMLDSISQGEEREDGSPTLQGLEKFIRTLDEDSNMLDAFKEADPATYLDTFGLPQTNAGLDFFANMGLTGDKTTDAKIIEARERLAAARESQGGGQGGITNISMPQTGQANIIEPNQYGLFIGKPGPFIGNFVDSDGDGVDDRFQTGPGQPSSQPSDMKKPLPTTGIAQAVGVPAALNYANIAPQFTGSPYTNQGVSPMLGDYYGNLRRFYG